MSVLSPAMQRRAEWRIILVMAAFVICYGAVATGLGLMALSQPGEPARAGPAETRPPVRGPVTDRDGHLLAANLPAWSLYVHPREIRDVDAMAGALAPIFPDLTAEKIAARVRASRDFAWIKRPVTPRQRQQILDLEPAIPALKFGRRDMRVYPAGRLAAHLMGSVKAGREGVHSAELIGSGGVEQAFDAYLRDPAAVEEPLALSIDLTVQAALTEVLARGVDRYGAKRGSALLMDVRTGEMLAMVSLPDFDPNAPVASLDGGRQPALSPGGQRGLRARLGLQAAHRGDRDRGRHRAPETMIRTGEPLREGGYPIRDLHRMPPYMTVTDIIRRSSNIGVAQLAIAVGTERFRAELGRLGMLEPVGIELPEAAARRSCRGAGPISRR